MKLDSSKNSLQGIGTAMLRILGLALVTSVPSHAWGPKGHRIIAEIAEDHLTSETRKALRKLMGSDDIVQYAVWADGIRHERPETVSWHYVNIPGDSSGYGAHRDCPEGDCIVAKIEEFQPF
jgi:S1/P1 Nuclease